MTDKSCWHWHEIWALVKAEKPRGSEDGSIDVQGGARWCHRRGRWMVLLIPAL